MTSLDHNAEQDLQALFASHGLPAPTINLRARTAMSIMVALAQSDMLAMLPVQWRSFPMTRDALSTVPVREVLPAPAIVLIQRQGLPMTPAAECFSDMLRREIPTPAA